MLRSTVGFLFAATTFVLVGCCTPPVADELDTEPLFSLESINPIRPGWQTLAEPLPGAGEPFDPQFERARTDHRFVGCWNLEHFNRSSRGFGETGHGGPSYPPRNAQQIRRIANVIQNHLRCDLLAVCEISADSSGEHPRSDDLDQLVSYLPDGWDYILSSSGNRQHTGILYNTNRVELIEWVEIEVPFNDESGQGDIFARDPLLGYFRFIDGDHEYNDFVVASLHLASGKHRARNHDHAMKVLLSELREVQREGLLGGTREHDIMLMGDFNANAYDQHREEFFADMERSGSGWDVLAIDDRSEYPPTRLSGVPLGLRNSIIDYIIVSRDNGTRNGLQGEEVFVEYAHVHTELLENRGADRFREGYSDHLPVSIPMRAIADND